MDLQEALYTTRAMRRVRPDPIPESAVMAMLDAAVRAPSAGNTQNWRFVTVTDPTLKEPLGHLYREAWQELQETVYNRALERAREVGDEGTLRIVGSSTWLADHFAEVPLWIFVFSRNDPTGASVYPGVWSMMLAARGLGIGTCLTTVLGLFKGREVFDLLEVPSDRGWENSAAVSAGYPLGKWGIAQRRPVHHVAYAERWGRKTEWTIDEPLWSAPDGRRPD